MTRAEYIQRSGSPAFTLFRQMYRSQLANALATDRAAIRCAPQGDLLLGLRWKKIVVSASARATCDALRDFGDHYGA